MSISIMEEYTSSRQVRQGGIERLDIRIHLTPEMDQENPRLKPSIKLKTKSGKATTEEDADISNEKCIVDKILAKRFNTKKRCWEYLIEWKGNPQEKPKLKPSIKSKTKSGKATTEEDADLSNEGYIVDKILAKRFNTKKRCWEYLIKWKGYPHENNTWESAEALATCKSLLDEFERSHAKQKESKEVQQKDNTKVVGCVSLPLQKSVIKAKTSQPGSSTAQTGRSMRSNKLKVMNKIKQWCSLMKDEENELLGKRRIDYSEKGGSSGKELIGDAGSDDEWTGKSEDERLLGRSVIQHAFNRANSQSSGFNKISISSTDLATSLGLQSADEAKSSQPPVLVINEGVVKIDPKQMPNLASDLLRYVMSQKDNIIKLNSSPIGKLAVKGSSTTQGVVMVQNRDNTNVITYKCGKCSKMFICELHLRQHEKIHMKKSYQCEFCKKILSVSNKWYLHRHKKEVHFNVLNGCNDCKKGFSNEQDFNNHLITKHSNIDARPYKCEICPAAFKRLGNLKRHTLQTHAEKPYICKICSKVFNFKINLIQHKRIHSDKKPYNDCNDCKKGFNNEQDFINHLITKHSNIDVRPYKCEICPAAFKRSNNLKRHIQTHAEKPYVCEICSKVFNFKINLIQHKRIHSNKKPYNDCNDCKKNFNNEQDFNNHLITKHSNIDARPYKCEICPAAFKRSNNLKRHIQTHAEKPYVCEICSKVFNFKINLIQHKRIHSDKKLYKCSICNKGFIRKANLLAHIQNEGHMSDTVVKD